MERQIGRFIADEVLVVFGIVPAVERPGAFAEFAVDVSGFIQRFVLAHDQHRRFDS